MASTASQQASAYLTLHRTTLAASIVDAHYRRYPGVWEPYGAAGYAKGLRDAEYHLAYLAEALATDDPSLFLEYLHWCKVLFANLHLPEAALDQTVACLRDELARLLPAELATPVVACLTLGLAHLPQLPITLPTFLPDDAPFVDLARAYLQALREGDRARASRLVVEAVPDGLTVREAYLHIFQPVQHELGRLWQTNQITVAQEHYCTAVTQMVMSQLYPHLFATPRRGRTLIATCVGGELHEIGARMVADFFELDGWDTYYLGANTPPDSIVRAIEERGPDLVAISATITPHVQQVRELLASIRAAHGPDLAVLVGGAPFNLLPSLWEHVGANGTARQALDAVEAGNRLVEDRET